MLQTTRNSWKTGCRQTSRTLLLLVALARGAAAQQSLPAPTPEPDLPDGPVHTLHVYTNLEQIPTLILGPSHERVRKLDPQKLRVSLDSGPPFKPTHVRLEGDDPIALAVLIDVTKPKREVLVNIEDAIAGLAPGYLKAEDRVSVYVLDCNLVRSVYAMSPDHVRLRQAVEQAMLQFHTRTRELLGRKSCAASLPLWDSMALISADLFKQPGRRVLIAVTEGEDTGSRRTWNQVKELMQVQSIAVFGIVTPIDIQSSAMRDGSGTMMAMAPVGPVGRPSRISGMPVIIGVESPFNSICELSGGVVISASKRSLPARMQRVTEMVRERYIVEYPRGNGDTAGFHSILVTLPRSDVYIRPTGIAVPLADQKLLADPATLLPTEPVDTPQLGNRKVLKPSP